MQADVTADKLTATYISGNTQEKLQKTIANILFINTTPLQSLESLELKEWYNNMRKILLAYQIPLPQWNKVLTTTDYTSFCGPTANPEKATNFFMFLSRDDVIPATIEDAGYKITHAPDHVEYLVLWKFIQENHPNLQDYGANTLWPTYDVSESFNTYLLKLQMHTVTEATK